MGVKHLSEKPSGVKPPTQMEKLKDSDENIGGGKEGEIGPFFELAGVLHGGNFGGRKFRGDGKTGVGELHTEKPKEVRPGKLFLAEGLQNGAHVLLIVAEAKNAGFQAPALLGGVVEAGGLVKPLAISVAAAQIFLQHLHIAREGEVTAAGGKMIAVRAALGADGQGEGIDFAAQKLAVFDAVGPWNGHAQGDLEGGGEFLGIGGADEVDVGRLLESRRGYC